MRRRLALLILPLALVQGLAISGCSRPEPDRDRPTRTGRPDRSPTTSIPPATESPFPTGGPTPTIRHLTTEWRLVEDDASSVTTKPIRPDPGTAVFVFWGAVSPSTVPPPAVTGGGVDWELVAEVRRTARSGRALFLFRASGVKPGPLTISVPTPLEGAWVWSIVETDASAFRVFLETVERFETSHAVEVSPVVPGAITAGGFLVGQNPVRPGGGFRLLGKAAGRLVSIATVWGKDSPVYVTWDERAHALGIGLLLGGGQG